MHRHKVITKEDERLYLKYGVPIGRSLDMTSKDLTIEGKRILEEAKEEEKAVNMVIRVICDKKLAGAILKGIRMNACIEEPQRMEEFIKE